MKLENINGIFTLIWIENPTNIGTKMMHKFCKESNTPNKAPVSEENDFFVIILVKHVDIIPLNTLTGININQNEKEVEKAKINKLIDNKTDEINIKAFSCAIFKTKGKTNPWLKTPSKPR